MDTAQELLSKVQQPSLNYKIGNVYFSPSYLQAGLIIFLLFLLILTFARLRRLYVNWSLRGALQMIALGFVLAIIIEGFLMLGGRTMLTEILGWKNPPKPIGKALDASREKLVEVLGVTNEVPSSNAQGKMTSEDVYKIIQTLPESEVVKLQGMFCKP